jgi:hypothetical protein
VGPPQHSAAKKVSVLDLVLNWTSASVIDGHQQVLRTLRAPWYYYCNIVKDYTIKCDRWPNISTRTTNSAHINSDFFFPIRFFFPGFSVSTQKWNTSVVVDIDDFSVNSVDSQHKLRTNTQESKS